MSAAQSCASNKECFFTKILNKAPITSKLHNIEANDNLRKVIKVALMIFLTIPTLLADGAVYLYNQIKNKIYSKDEASEPATVVAENASSQETQKVVASGSKPTESSETLSEQTAKVQEPEQPASNTIEKLKETKKKASWVWRYTFGLIFG